MKDQETESLWSHILGKCMEGEFESKFLTTVPSLITDWETWTEMHPDTTVMLMSKTRFEYVDLQYQNLSLHVVGVADGTASRAWKFEDLANEAPVNDEFEGTELVVFFERESGTAYLYERAFQDKTLSFVESDGKYIDEQTGSTWDPRKGMALDGELKGTSLTPIAGITSYGAAWERFHPESTYWTK